jgi:hypothetical protein
MDAPHCGLDRQLSLAKIETGLAGSRDFFSLLCPELQSPKRAMEYSTEAQRGL